MDDLVDMARGLARKRPGLSSELRPLVTNIIEQADAIRDPRSASSDQGQTEAEMTERDELLARADKYLNTGSGEYAADIMRDMADYIRKLPTADHRAGAAMPSREQIAHTIDPKALVDRVIDAAVSYEQASGIYAGPAKQELKAARQAIESALTAPSQGDAGAREAARSNLAKIAAECHRAKWEFDYNEEDPPTRQAAYALVKNAFRTCARIGDMALVMRETLPHGATPSNEGALREALDPVAMVDRLIDAAVYYEQASGIYASSAKRELKDARAAIEAALASPAPATGETVKRWEVGKNGWDASDEITREDI